MRRRRPTAFRLAVIAFLAAASARAAGPTAEALAARIDKHLSARWLAEKVKPAAPADDATFARRLYLDFAGRIPTVAEARAFLADKTEDKRSRLAAALLESPAHARHLATFWRREWLPQTDAAPFVALADDAEDWLAGRIRVNAPFDRTARDLITAPLVRIGKGAPSTLLTASEYKPDNLAANTSRAFLGVNLDCAQCHDHPFARWSREQFWQTAAFFVRLDDRPTKASFRIAVGDTKKSVTAKLLTGGEPAWPEAMNRDSGRAVLAAWVTSKDNPFFAKNAVNRVWANLFGTGLVEPLDDLSGENPASHPELLDELAKAFVESGYDLKHLTSAIVVTRAYQLSSVVPEGGSAEPRLFAAAAVRGLTGEQLYDSLRVAAGFSADRDDLDPIFAPRGRKAFAAKFRVERSGTARRSILQSLSLMNGKLTGALTDPAKTPTLRAVAGSPFLDARGKIEALSLAALGRKPTADEAAEWAKHVAKAGPGDGGARAMADLFWAMLNGGEFNTNH